MLTHASLLDRLSGLPCPGNYLIAYSGGLDSHVLLHMMAALRGRLNAPIQAMHIQHGLQAEAAQWANHCAHICQALQIPYTEIQLNLQAQPGISLEALARDARYAALGAKLPPQGMLLTAHHADDQAETLLLQLLRGAGVEGLAAMPPCRQYHAGWHARPLLRYPRAELKAYAKQYGLNWLEDPSNQNTDFDRNYLRHHIMPLLQARWPAANKTISRSASHLAALLPVLQTQTTQLLQSCLNAHGRLRISQLNKLNETELGWVIRAWARQAGHAMPHQAHLHQIKKNVLNAAADASPQVSWDDTILRRYRDELWLTPKQSFPPPDTTLDWPDTPELTLPAGCGRLMRQPTTEQGIPDRLWREEKISVQWRSAGISCQPIGRNGRRSFKKLCQEFAIPPWQRPYLPLIYADGQLIAVADYCLCEGIKSLPGDTFSKLIYVRDTPASLRMTKY